MLGGFFMSGGVASSAAMVRAWREALPSGEPAGRR